MLARSVGAVKLSYFLTSISRCDVRSDLVESETFGWWIALPQAWVSLAQASELRSVTTLLF